MKTYDVEAVDSANDTVTRCCQSGHASAKRDTICHQLSLL